MKETVKRKSKEKLYINKDLKESLLKTEAIICPICGVDKNKIFYSANDRAYNLPGVFPIMKCKICNLVYLSPRPAKEVLSFYYPRGEYFHIQKDETDDSNNTGVANNHTWLGHLALAVNQIRYGYEYGYKGSYLMIVRLFYYIFKNLLLRFPYFRLPKFIKGGKLLEIGFGQGENLKRFRKYGWKIAGSDVDIDCCNYAKNILKVNILEMDGSKINTDDKTFDVIYLSQTFEHLPDPMDSLNEYYRILKEDGQLIMELPNIGCKQAKRWNENWRGIEAPRHLFFYTKETAIMILKKVGYRDIQVNTISISPFDFFLGSVPPTIENNLAYKNAWWNKRIVKVMVQLIGPSLGFGESLYVRARK